MKKLGCREVAKMQSCTSVVFMGVLIATGLQDMGQRSRHSGWVTTRQSWQRRHIFPNFVLLPQATQNSDLITLTEETPRSVHDPSSWTTETLTNVIARPQSYCFGDKVVFFPSSRCSEVKWFWDWCAGSLTGRLRLVSCGCVSPCLGNCKDKHASTNILL